MATPLDPARIETAALRLGEIRTHLLTGATFERADEWPAAIDDAIRVLVSNAPAPKPIPRRCPRCAGPLERRFAEVDRIERFVIACTECEFVEVIRR